MGKGKSSSAEKKRQKKAMQKRRKDAERRKRGTSVVTENDAKYQMMTAFGQPGKIDNLVRNMAHLAGMFETDEDLKGIRFDADKAYEVLDLAADRDYIERLYEAENPLFVPEEDGDFWKEKRQTALPELVTEEFAKTADRLITVLLQKKRGFKKDYRAIQAGKLMIDAHTASLTGGDLEENTVWEIVFNVTLRENKRELPPPVERPAAEEGDEAVAESADETATDDADSAKTDKAESE